jgi:hypothetical protein
LRKAAGLPSRIRDRSGSSSKPGGLDGPGKVIVVGPGTVGVTQPTPAQLTLRAGAGLKVL